MRKYKIKKLDTEHGQIYVLYQRAYCIDFIPYWNERATYSTFKEADTVKQRLEKWKPLDTQ